MKKRIFTLALAALLLAAALPFSSQAAQPPVVDNARENTHVNTGNQRKDILAVAMTQLGYTEGYPNDTKYGDWYGLPYNPWCAMFVSWCAQQADISQDILKRSSRANPYENIGFNIPCYSGKEYTPQPGDLFFAKEFGHTGLVYAVEGEFIITVEGNVFQYDGYDQPPEGTVIDDTEGYWVMNLRRKIEDLYFGVPNYKGTDKEHTYERGYDEAHPHASYFLCTACGDKYYTGSHTHVTSCGACMSCGCSAAGAGYYETTASGKRRIRVRANHREDGEVLGFLDQEEIVEVVATGGGWAHIIYANEVGYVPMYNLRWYMPAPKAVTVSSNTLYAGDTANISWTPVYTASSYPVKVLRDTEVILDTSLTQASLALENLQKGTYRVEVGATDGSTYATEPSVLTFTVQGAYSISYDPGGGTGAPEAQRKLEGQTLTLSNAVPQKEGAVFLGWSPDRENLCATYQPGDIWTEDRAVTLTAVWAAADALPAALEVHTPGAFRSFVPGQSLDTQGLTLKLTYSDGSTRLIASGYGVEGFSSQTPGEQQVTLTYENLSTLYPVTVLDCSLGDVDTNGTVDREDVLQLLWYISYREASYVSFPPDINKDGAIDREDVLQLLWHTFYPQEFPLS